MKTNNTSIETALQLAFSTEYVNALSLVSLAETWEADSDAKGLALNISYYAEQCTYKMEQDGVTLESDAWDALTAEIERYANIWVSLYLNASSWSNRPEWLANSVRAALDNTTKPEPTNPDNTPSTMNANDNEYLDKLRHELQEYHNNASKGGANRQRNMAMLAEDIARLEASAKETATRTKSINGIMNQANRLMSACNAVRNFNRTNAIREIAFRYYDNIRTCAERFNYNDDSEYNKEYSRAQYMNA